MDDVVDVFWPSATETDFVVALDGFEGPLELLLNLARAQKVDMAKIAILPLAEQFLAFLERKLRIEVAADYLVMAAWLAFLKSRLVLPTDAANGQSDAACMADALRFQLQRLDVLQKAADALGARPRLGFDVFVRGMSEEVNATAVPIGELTIEELVRALGIPQTSSTPPAYVVTQTRLFSIEESALRLRILLSAVPEWGTLQDFLPGRGEQVPAPERRSALASTFAASLELARSGELEIRQDGLFGPISLRRRSGPTEERMSGPAINPGPGNTSLDIA